MKAVKISTCEARVMQALRAGPMTNAELSDRFPGGTRIARLVKLSYVENDASGYKLTELGRSQCPTRRSIEKAAHLPPANASPLKLVKPIAAKPTIKVEVTMPPHTNVAKQIRDIINDQPGIEHDLLVSRLTSESTDEVEIKKAYDMINYVIKQGNYTRCRDTSEGKSIKRYYSDHDYLKRKEKTQKVIETKVPTPEQPHAAERLEVNSPAAAVQTQELKTLKFINDNETTSALDVQEGGDHYKRMKIQPVEYILANEIPFCEANIIKYVSRWKNKNGVQDLKKARHFIDILIEQQSAA